MNTCCSAVMCVCIESREAKIRLTAFKTYNAERTSCRSGEKKVVTARWSSDHHTSSGNASRRVVNKLIEELNSMDPEIRSFLLEDLSKKESGFNLRDFRDRNVSEAEASIPWNQCPDMLLSKHGLPTKPPSMAGIA